MINAIGAIVCHMQKPADRVDDERLLSLVELPVCPTCGCVHTELSAGGTSPAMTDDESLSTEEVYGPIVEEMAVTRVSD